MATTTEAKPNSEELRSSAPVPRNANGSHTYDAESDGIMGRLTASTVDLTNEALGAAKAVSNELIDVADTVTLTTIDELNAITNDAGTFAPFVGAPLKVARASWSAGTAGTRRVLALI